MGIESEMITRGGILMFALGAAMGLVFGIVIGWLGAEAKIDDKETV